MAHCQVVDLMLQDWLPCPVREGGGRQCERPEAHGDEVEHYWSEHTKAHDRAGNGWPCSSFKDPVNVVAYRNRLRSHVNALTKELEELDAQL